MPYQRLFGVSGSLAAGRWTAWPWRDRRTMAFPCRWTQSSYKPLGNWAGGPVWAPSLTTLSGNTGLISCSLPHWEVNNVVICCWWKYLSSHLQAKPMKNNYAKHLFLSVKIAANTGFWFGDFQRWVKMNWNRGKRRSETLIIVSRECTADETTGKILWMLSK